MQSKQTQWGEPNKLNTTVVVSWYNMIKVIELIYNEQTSTYIAHKDAKKK